MGKANFERVERLLENETTATHTKAKVVAEAIIESINELTERGGKAESLRCRKLMDMFGKLRIEAKRELMAKFG